MPLYNTDASRTLNNLLAPTAINQALLIPDGAVGAPSLAFSSDADGSGTGLYRIGANNLGFTSNGILVGNYSSGGNWLLGNNSGAAAFTHTINTGTTAGFFYVSDNTTNRFAVDPANNQATVTSPSGANCNLVIKTNGTGNQVSVGFGDSGSDFIGQIAYSHVTDQMTFLTGGATVGSVLAGAGNGWTLGTAGVANTHSIRGGANSNAAASDFVTQIRNVNAPSGAVAGTSGLVIFQNSAGTTIGQITRVTLTDTVSYGTSSDARLKTNQSKIPGALDKLMALRPYEYEWKSSPGVKDFGFFAQELYEVFPQAVSPGTGGGEVGQMPWSAEYGRITPLLTAAIQELKETVDQLKAEIALLKGTSK